MATTTRPAPSTEPPTSHKASDLRLEIPPAQARRPKLSWIAVGLVLVLIAAMLGAIAIARVAAREPVLALAMPIARGEVVTDDHLAVVQVATDDQLATVPASERQDLVGLVAQADLTPGTLLARDQLADGPSLPDGWSVVGLALNPGEYPTSALAAGDRVEVVRTPDPTGVRGESSAVEVIAPAAEVFAVELLSESARSFMVSLAVPADVAPAVAASAAERRIRLVLVND